MSTVSRVKVNVFKYSDLRNILSIYFSMTEQNTNVPKSKVWDIFMHNERQDTTGSLYNWDQWKISRRLFK